MNEALKKLSEMEYPGRLIILGMAPEAGHTVIVYAITGRSPSSQARKLEWKEGSLWVRPTDEEVLKKGNVDLLVYPAVLCSARGIAVSNGKQTTDILGSLRKSALTPIDILAESLASWSYEPDAPIFTPRISGCVLSGPKAALSLIKRDADGTAIRRFHEVFLSAGRAQLISTYDGVNRDPLHSFEGDPIEVGIRFDKPTELAEEVYSALKPSGRDKDFRVAVACLFSSDIAKGQLEISIINRHERS